MTWCDHPPPTQPRASSYQKANRRAQKLKKRIRALKVISRILSTLLSIAVFVPIAMTFQVYLSTRNTYKDVRQPDGSSVSRTAWAKDSVVWPTVMYFAVALVSLVLNAVILVAYLRSVGTANLAATVATGFNWIVIFGNMVVWGVAVVVYRVEKKDDDLWGWTCGSAAETLQDVFKTEVNFDKYCTVQVSCDGLGSLQEIWTDSLSRARPGLPESYMF